MQECEHPRSDAPHQAIDRRPRTRTQTEPLRGGRLTEVLYPGAAAPDGVRARICSWCPPDVAANETSLESQDGSRAYRAPPHDTRWAPPWPSLSEATRPGWASSPCTERRAGGSAAGKTPPSMPATACAGSRWTDQGMGSRPASLVDRSPISLPTSPSSLTRLASHRSPSRVAPAADRTPWPAPPSGRIASCAASPRRPWRRTALTGSRATPGLPA